MENTRTKPSVATEIVSTVCLLAIIGLIGWGIWMGIATLNEWHRAGLVAAKQDCIARGGIVTEQFGGFGGNSQWQCEHPTRF